MTKQFKRTDIGNGERFLDHYQGRAKYLIEESRWLLFDDGWKRVDDGHQLTKPVVRAIYKEPLERPEDDSEGRESLSNWAVYSERTTSQDHMLREARASAGVHIDAFDANPKQINCLNGIVDLGRKVRILKSPNELHLKQANANYSPASTCDKWLAFLKQIFNDDEKLIRFIQVGLGYSITGLIQDHLFFLCHGNGRNGKSTLLETVLYVLGDYARTSEFEIFLQTKKDLTDARRKEAVGNLRGMRFIVASENKDNTQLNSALIKKLTGGERLEGSKLYGDAFQFDPTHKIWLSGNHKPNITEGTDAIWERVKVI